MPGDVSTVARGLQAVVRLPSAHSPVSHSSLPVADDRPAHGQLLVHLEVLVGNAVKEVQLGLPADEQELRLTRESGSSEVACGRATYWSRRTRHALHRGLPHRLDLRS